MNIQAQIKHSLIPKKIISFTLFGTREIFFEGALKNLQLAKKYFPDWQCWFYVSQEVPSDFLEKLVNTGGKVICKKRRHRYDGLLWRFLAGNERELSAVIFRDLDSRLSEREAAAVNEWLASEKPYHIMRDHPWHTSLIMGGMWGVRGNVLPDIKTLFKKFCWINPDLFLHSKGIFRARDIDQQFLGQMIYPLTKNNVLIHSEFIRYSEEVITPYPMPRKNNEFIEQVVENDIPKSPIDLNLVNMKMKTLSFPDYRPVPRFFSRIKNFLLRISRLRKSQH